MGCCWGWCCVGVVGCWYLVDVVLLLVGEWVVVVGLVLLLVVLVELLLLLLYKPFLSNVDTISKI